MSRTIIQILELVTAAFLTFFLVWFLLYGKFTDSNIGVIDALSDNPYKDIKLEIDVEITDSYKDVSGSTPPQVAYDGSLLRIYGDISDICNIFEKFEVTINGESYNYDTATQTWVSASGTEHPVSFSVKKITNSNEENVLTYGTVEDVQEIITFPLLYDSTTGNMMFFTKDTYKFYISVADQYKNKVEFTIKLPVVE